MFRGLILLISQDCQKGDHPSGIVSARAGRTIQCVLDKCPREGKAVDFIFLEAIASAPSASEISIPFFLCN